MVTWHSETKEHNEYPINCISAASSNIKNVHLIIAIFPCPQNEHQYYNESTNSIILILIMSGKKKKKEKQGTH